MTRRNTGGRPGSADEKPVPQQQGGGRSQPAHEVKAGRITATVWLNEHDGKPWYSVTISRAYKDGEGKWKQASSFGRDDLLVVAECARQAWLYCTEQSVKNREIAADGEHADAID